MDTKSVANIIGYVAAGIGIAVYIPQVVRSIKTKKTKDISKTSFLLIFIVSILWTIYGVLIIAPPVILVNFVILILSSVMLFLKKKYD